ncbi:MAG: hypothetical protein VB108_05460 [Anaerolineaceae bacterium]|nr:hypothetical protein [Anaerolineaceae bacterium]
MNQAQISQSVRNWKLLSLLKENAETVQLKGEELSKDLSVFSRKTLHAGENELPIYANLVRGIRFQRQSQSSKREKALRINLNLSGLSEWFGIRLKKSN